MVVDDFEDDNGIYLYPVEATIRLAWWWILGRLKNQSRGMSKIQSELAGAVTAQLMKPAWRVPKILQTCRGLQVGETGSKFLCPLCAELLLSLSLLRAQLSGPVIDEADIHLSEKINVSR